MVKILLCGTHVDTCSRTRVWWAASPLVMETLGNVFISPLMCVYVAPGTWCEMWFFLSIMVRKATA